MKRHATLSMMIVLGLGLLLGLLVVGSPPSPVSLAAPAGTPLHVQPGGTGDCSDWGTSACELQTALSLAVAGDEIWVMAGTYLPDYDPGTGTHTGDRNATFQLVSGVALYGGFPATGTPGKGERDWVLNPTTLSGDLLGNDGSDFTNYGDNSYHVVTGSGTDATAVLDGFTVSGGNANGSDPDNRGGGMYNDSGSPTLTHLTFSGNTAKASGTGWGGGMYNYDQSSPELTHVTFSDNEAWAGGGMYNDEHSSPVLSGTHFLANFAYWGAGMHNGNGSNPVLTDVTFYGNTAGGGDGGGMHNDPGSSPELTNVIFRGNTATVDGGGMANRTSSNPTLTNVTFSGNTATGNGGGIYNWQSNPTLTNVTFSDNHAGSLGGGVCNWMSSPTLRNCVLWGNSATTGGNQIYRDPGLSWPAIAWSDIQGSGGSGAWDTGLGTDGGGNIDADPLFADATAGDVRLVPCSPAIDAGDNNAPGLSGITTDLDGHPRFVNIVLRADTGSGTAPIVDMGAYELQLAQLPPAVFVDAGATGANHGGSWAEAFTDLQDALHCASGSGEIWVAEGTYKPTGTTDREATFQLASGVAIYGGFDGTESSRGERNADPATNNTVLSGDIGTPGNNGDNSYHVVTGSGTDASAVLDGFTISGGNADGSALPHWYGGGMYNGAGSPTLANLIFSGNTADFGGGMMNDNSSNPMLTDCTFSGNSANNGGGMANLNDSSPTLINCVFSDNQTTGHGGGMYNLNGSGPTLTTCQFTNNTADTDSYGTGNGGGVYNGLDSSPVLSGTDFINNTANYGGGLGNRDESSPELTNVTFSGNTATANGGGMHNEDSSSPKLTEVTFSGNTATVNGGGMCNRNSSNPTLTNCTFSGNHTPGLGGGMYNSQSNPTIANSYFVSNSTYCSAEDCEAYGGGMYNDSSSPTITNSTFTSNTAGCTNYFNRANGGGMYNSGGSPKLADVTFTSNTATHWGGGMRNEDSSPVLSGTQFFTNDALTGGGMDNTGTSKPTLTDVIFRGNTAGSGGGMSNWDTWESSPVLTRTHFFTNTATGEGGGLLNYRSSATLTDCTFSGNDAGGGGGGGMWNYGSPSITLETCTFLANSAAGDGGGMFSLMLDLIEGQKTLRNVWFISNTARYGGGMQNHQSSPTLIDVTFSGNFANNDGGGMHNDDNSSPTLTVCGFSGNTATVDGGGMVNADNSNPTLMDVTFSGNTATGHGGAMHNWQSGPTLARCEFSNNTATYGGGMHNNDESGPVLVQSSFLSNTATFGGGGMYNRECGTSPPDLTNVLFNNNAVTGTEGDEGYGGGMYNEGCNPDLVQVTMAHNQATKYGGGMANFDGTGGPSTPHLYNSVLWGNLGAGTTADDQIHPTESHFGCTIQESEDDPSPFVDAEGADGIPGTHDDDLHPGYPSYDIIDGGDEGQLPSDWTDLDDDGDTDEKLPLDLDGHPRLYADYDLDGDPDPPEDLETDLLDSVDQGAYEAQCWAWHMVTGDDYLAEGQKYRQGFHQEIDPQTQVTISDTLDSYAAERAAGNLAKARKAYEIALDCAATVTQTNQAVAGLLKVIWEQATGAMLQGNEMMVTALDLSDAEGMGVEISALRAAIDKYSEATDGYLVPLAGEHQADILAAMGISRTHQITYTLVITQVDVQRLAAASAKKSRARLELGERQFRMGDRGVAEETLREASAQTKVELALLEEILEDVDKDVNYQDLGRSLSDMNRLDGFLKGGKNPLGYSPEWIPIHYDPDTIWNNYEETDLLAAEKVTWAEEDIDDAAALSQQVHDNYGIMESRYFEIEEKYDGYLEALCGLDQQTQEPDLVRCSSGTLGDQISAVEQAHLRLQRVLAQMDELNKRIDLEVEYRAKEAEIYDYTAHLMDPETSEKYSSLVEQEEEIALGWKIAKGVGHFVSNMVQNRALGTMAFGKKGGKAGGLLAGLGSTVDMVAGFFGVEEEPPKEEKLLEFQAWQNAQMVICEGQIADLEFEKRIKELFLKYGVLDIDYLIALENLHQELLRLEAKKTRVEYLMAEKARALAFTQLLYQDPAHRVLRDYYMEMAQDAYDTALDWVFQAGRALEYEANLTASELGAPDPNGMFGIRNIDTLDGARKSTKNAWNDWDPGDPITYVTDDPYPKVLLSRALNYEDTELPGYGPVTAEEQFNAYVIRNPANRYDQDRDGIAESLYFTFDTSVVKGNPFFDHCLFNDRIKSVKMRIRGANLGKTSVTVRLSWGDLNCEETDCGTTFIRSQEAWFTDEVDDLRAYKVQPKGAVIQAVTGDVVFGEEAENTELAIRSVANDHWTLFIDGTLPANQGFNLDGVDEVELIITHEAHSSQAPMCYGPGTLRLAPSRPYRPMERVLDPQSSPLLAALGEDRSQSAEDGPTSLSGMYAGSLVISSPQYMPELDMNVVLTATNGNLTGYLDASQSLAVPVVDKGTGHGPAVSGSWSGESFSLESEQFTTVLTTGVVISHQVLLHSGVISDSGEALTALYSETLAGLTPQPMVIYGDVELRRLPAAVLPSAGFSAFPVIGPVPLTVSFSDFSTADPSGWAWDFGDGGISTQQHPTHTYTAIGTYTVTLTVSNTVGSDTAVMASYITVVDKARIYLPLVMRSWP
jgi:parallel beta-helix repeat protein/predicted outer membrane repeat protein